MTMILLPKLSKKICKSNNSKTKECQLMNSLEVSIKLKHNKIRIKIMILIFNNLNLKWYNKFKKNLFKVSYLKLPLVIKYLNNKITLQKSNKLRKKVVEQLKSCGKLISMIFRLTKIVKIKLVRIIRNNMV